jgi:hypothetical protein
LQAGSSPASGAREETKKEREMSKTTHPMVKKFKESGDADRASRLISMAYLLQSIATELTEEANGLIAKYGLYHHNVKYWSNQLSKVFDLYHRQISGMIIDEPTREMFVTDYENFSKVCRDFMHADSRNNN